MFFKDELGKQFGEWKVIAITEARKPSNRCVMWLCECVHCGAHRLIDGNSLRFKPLRCPCYKRLKWR